MNLVPLGTVYIIASTLYTVKGFLRFFCRSVKKQRDVSTSNSKQISRIRFAACAWRRRLGRGRACVRVGVCMRACAWGRACIVVVVIVVAIVIVVANH